MLILKSVVFFDLSAQKFDLQLISVSYTPPVDLVQIIKGNLVTLKSTVR